MFRFRVYWNLTLLIVCTIFSVSAYDAQPIPVSERCRTEADFQKELVDFLFEKACDSEDSKDWNKKEKAFVKNCIKIVVENTNSKNYGTFNSDNKLMDNSDSPLLKAFYGLACLKSDQMEQGISILTQLLEKNVFSFKSNILEFVFRSQLAIGLMSDPCSNFSRSFEQKSLAIKKYVDAVKTGEFNEEEIVFAFRLIDNLYESPFNHNLSGEVSLLVKDLPEIDPWLKNMYQGIYFSDQATKARTYKWSQNVSSEEMQQFQKYSKTAYDYLRAAHDLHPDYPDAAGILITIVMSGHEKAEEPCRFWFDKAIEAQMDYPRAYRLMSRSLQPRWGGSHDQMHNFAKECLNTKRFDTMVPMFYREIMMHSAKPTRANGWRYLFRKSVVVQEMNEMFEGYSGSTSFPDNQVLKIKTAQIIADCWTGNFQHAQTRLKALQFRIDLDQGFWHKESRLSFWGRSWENIENEIHLFTGDYKNTLSSFDAGICSEINSDPVLHFISRQSFDDLASPQLKSIKNEMVKLLNETDDSILRDYLRERIGRMMMNRSEFHAGVFYNAIQEKKNNIVDFYLEHGQNPNEASGRYFPLQATIQQRDFETTIKLLAAGANPNFRSIICETPLEIAFSSGQRNFVNLLENYGAEFQATLDTGRVTLHNIIELGDVAWVQKGIDAGLDPNSTGTLEKTPLMTAIELQHRNIIDYLFSLNVDLKYASQLGYSALHLAMFHKMPDIALRILNKDPDVDINLPARTWSPLNYACYYKQWDVASKLLDMGADMNHRPENCRPPLIVAAAEGQTELVEKMLKMGADKHIKFNGRTALQHATHFLHPETAQLLRNWK